MKEKVIALCSGGFDSVVLMNELAVDKNLEIVSLFFDYGQRNLQEEKRCAKKVSKKVGAEFVEIVLPSFKWTNSSLTDSTKGDSASEQYMPMRNMVFLSYALSIAESKAVHKIYCAFVKSENGVYYPDASPNFVEEFNAIAKDCDVRLIAPYIEYEKELLINACRILDITKEDFFSCNTPIEIGGGIFPCHKCGDCREVDYLFEEYVDPNRITDLFVNNDFKADDMFFQEYLHSRLGFAKIFINNDCQFKCKHCLYGFEEMHSEKLSVKEMKNVIKQLVNQGVHTIDFGGKEPLFNAEVFEYLKYLNREYPHVNYSLITNGVSIPRFIDEIGKYKPQISLSVESLDDLLFRPTNVGIVSNIKLLKSVGIVPEISIDLHKGNYNQMTTLVNELYILGIERIYIKPIIPLGLNAENVVDNEVSPEEIMTVINSLNSNEYYNLDIALDLTMYTIHKMRNNKQFMGFIEDYKNTRLEYVGNIRMILEFFCPRFLNMVAITPDGYVLGCGQELASERYYNLAVGNVREESIHSLVTKGVDYAVQLIKNSNKLGCYFCNHMTEKGCILK